jgi:dihydropteroate synthase-like protein
VLKNNIVSRLREVEENWEKNLDKYGGFKIGRENNKLAIGLGLPIRVIAEIVNAPTLDDETLKRLTVYYENEGADIIDIGMLAGNPKPNTVEGIIDTVRESSNLPLSIDSLEPTEINVAIDSGIDLVMSIDAGNMRLLSEKARSIPVVVLPSNMKEGIFPREPITRIDYLEKNIGKAKRLGYQKIIADPVLEPPITPGLMNSLRNYMTFRERDKTTPLLMGIGNVVEMVDFDSVGVNGLLTAIAQELNVQLIHVPEHSVKAKKSIREATTAVKMSFLAENRKTVLKDLGIDLLKLKEKRWLEEKYERCFEENTQVIYGLSDHKYQSDKAGWFKIQIDRIEKKVILTHFPIQSETPDMIIKGTNARDLYLTSMKMGNITRMDHAAYLGKELMKAEIALKLERSYIQDEPLFQ